MQPVAARGRRRRARHIRPQLVVDGHETEARRQPRRHLAPEEIGGPGQLVPQTRRRAGRRRPPNRLVQHSSRRTVAARGRGQHRTELDAGHPGATRNRALEHAAVAAAEVDEPVVRTEAEQLEGRIGHRRGQAPERSEHLRLAARRARPRRRDVARRGKHGHRVRNRHGEADRQATGRRPDRRRAAKTRRAAPGPRTKRLTRQAPRTQHMQQDARPGRTVPLADTARHGTASRNGRQILLQRAAPSRQTPIAHTAARPTTGQDAYSPSTGRPVPAPGRSQPGTASHPANVRRRTHRGRRNRPRAYRRCARRRRDILYTHAPGRVPASNSVRRATGPGSYCPAHPYSRIRPRTRHTGGRGPAPKRPGLARAQHGRGTQPCACSSGTHRISAILRTHAAGQAPGLHTSPAGDRPMGPETSAGRGRAGGATGRRTPDAKWPDTRTGAARRTDACRTGRAPMPAAATGTGACSRTTRCRNRRPGQECSPSS